MKILTLNTWGTNGPIGRRPILIDQILALDADLLCLQEVVDPSLFKALAYSHTLHMPDQGLAILSRFPVQSERRLVYKTASPLEPYRRGVLLAQLSDLLWVGTTHLSWKAEDTASRQGQAEELVQTAEVLSDPVLLSGDFNAQPSEPPIRQMVQAGFVDLFEALRAPSPTEEPGITWDNRNPFIQSHSVRFPDRRIDYLFLRQAPAETWKVLSCQVALNRPTLSGLYASDHYGVLAILSK